MSVVKIIWALDIDAKKEFVEKLKEEFRSEVVIIGVGHLDTAEEVLNVLKEMDADEVVIDFDKACEVEKLLDSGVYPLVALFNEVGFCPEKEKCEEYNPDTDIMVEREDGFAVLRLTGFARISDIMFELSDIGEKHHHDHEHE